MYFSTNKAQYRNYNDKIHTILHVTNRFENTVKYIYVKIYKTSYC